jgi:hypothetical protein
VKERIAQTAITRTAATSSARKRNLSIVRSLRTAGCLNLVAADD